MPDSIRPVREPTVHSLEHWLIANPGQRPVVTHSRTDAETMRALGNRVTGPFVPVDEVERLREAHQEILDMGCPFGREGDWLAKAQRISSEAVSGRYPNPDRQRS
jgi:hypothetical protein